MGFGVFVHRPDSRYDDRLEERYQFPRPYLDRVKACVGGWIVYLEPRRVPKARGYFAAAKVQRVIEDPGTAGMYLALIEPGSFLPFADPVPFRDAEGPIERGVLNPAGRNSGRARAAVRLLSPEDFHRILARGLGRIEAFPSRSGEGAPAPSGFAEAQAPFDPPAPFDLPMERDRLSVLTSRVLRDRVFRCVVLRAYGERCALSGLRLINGGGRAEVEAAHIQPVEANGPDIVTNGLALSGTLHWMFDRGLVSIADDHAILISRHVNDPAAVRGLINPSGRLGLPERPADWPHPRFLRWHRENRFKA